MDKETIMKMMDDISECAKQEDCPVYKGDQEVDCYVKLSSVLEIIEKYIIQM